MHPSCEQFVRRICTEARIRGRRVVEVGSYNVNGSPRDWLTPLGPSEYLGVDLTPQPRYVDQVLDASQLAEHFGPDSFDVVVSTEMLEHCEDPLACLKSMSSVCRPGGLLLITARGPGFPYHNPPDRWRFTCEDFLCLASFRLLALDQDDPPGVLYAGLKSGTINDWSYMRPVPMVRPYHCREAFEERMASRRSAPVTPDPFSCWYHVACMGNWRDVFADQLALSASVGLSPTACVLGTPDDVAHVARHLPVAYSSANLREYEIPTLQRLYEWCLANPSGACLYLHTKGVSAPDQPAKQAWRKLMEHHVVRPWRDNLQLLAIADLVGMDWQDSPRYPHFSGNFWLARADWIASLPSPRSYQAGGGPVIAGNPWPRMSAETWIGSRPWHHIESLYCRNTNLWQGDEAIRRWAQIA